MNGLEMITFRGQFAETWNRKAVQFSGGAFDGYLHESDGLRATVVGDQRQPTPLEQGYATFGSDSLAISIITYFCLTS